MTEFPKKYDNTIEDEINKMWIKNDLFSPETIKTLKTSNGEKFSIPMPPPNVTGILHLGHAFMLAVQDVMVRHARMCGYETLYIPGTDHAGIATQAVVEKHIQQDGLSKHDLGREKFLSKVWDWSKSSRSTIISQIERMGTSCDRSREKFTLSESLSRAVRKAFVQLANEGKIYRGDRIVNWCPKSQTVIADVEVDYEDEKASMYHIKYFIESKGDSITIATIRPETIFADVAIAVNPRDRRYKKFIGKYVLIPVVNRKIPVIADEYVDMTFGSGALKITPTHDPNDFEIGKRHNLPMDRFALDEKGYFTDWAGEFAGYNYEEVFDNFVQTLDEIGNLEKIEEHETKIPYSERYKTKIQPMLSKQWFLDVNQGAQESINMITDGQVEMYPNRFKKIFFDWLENIKPWCISRQLWWGHRIPVWYCQDCGDINFFDEDEVITNGSGELENKKVILSKIIFNLICDNKLENPFNIESLINVLLEDSLIPVEGQIYQVYFNIYKKKHKNDKHILSEIDELENIFDSLNKLSKDIVKNGDKIIDMIEESCNVKKKGEMYEFVFACKKCSSEKTKQEEDVLDTWFSSALWPFSILGWPENTDDFQKYYPNTVLETGYDIIFFRVARMTIMGSEILGQKPFDNIYLHGIVRDGKGQKISKSLGNNVDPLDVVEKYGADSLRLALLLGTTPGNDARFSFEKLDYNKRFINKLWNASRFVHMKTTGGDSSVGFDYELIKNDIQDNIDKLNDFDNWIIYRLNNLAEIGEKYHKKFMLGEFGQEIIHTAWHELCDWYIEIAKIQSSEYTDKVLIYGIGTILKFLHPFVPFVTEKLWQLVGFEGYLIIADYPGKIKLDKKDAKIDVLMNIIGEFRNLRSKTETKPHEKVDVFVQGTSVLEDFIKKYENILYSLVGANKISYLGANDDIDDDFTVGLVDETKIGLKGIRQISQKERLQDLEKQLEDENQFLQSLRNLISSPGFAEKAPQKVVDEKNEKIKEVKAKIESLEYEIAKLKVNG